MYKISVIIPVYNAEEYLERAINSVLKQTLGFENIELILIDDKSTDNSRKIIQKFADKYVNIIPIFLEKNTGSPSVPRNEGIKKSSGEFIMFMDNDDEYYEDLCEVLYNTIVSTNADLVSCPYYDDDSIFKKEITFNFYNENSIIGTDYITYNDNLLLIFDNVVIWNKIFKREMIVKNNIQFYETVGEDFVFCMEYLVNIKNRVWLKHYHGYHKHIRQDSLIMNINMKNIKEKLNAHNYIYELIIDKIEGDEELFINTIFELTIVSTISEIPNLKNYNEILESLRLLYDFENKISFKGYAGNFIINFLNRLILEKMFYLTLILLKLAYFAKQSMFVTKYYRKFINN